MGSTVSYVTVGQPTQNCKPMTRAWQVGSLHANPFLMGNDLTRKNCREYKHKLHSRAIGHRYNPSKSGQGRPTITGQALTQSEWGHLELYDIGSITEQISHLGLTEMQKRKKKDEKERTQFYSEDNLNRITHPA